MNRVRRSTIGFSALYPCQSVAPSRKVRTMLDLMGGHPRLQNASRVPATARDSFWVLLHDVHFLRCPCRSEPNPHNRYISEARWSRCLFLFFFLSPYKLRFIGFIFNHLPACVQTSLISPGRKFSVCLFLTHTSWVVINFSVCLVCIM